VFRNPRYPRPRESEATIPRFVAIAPVERGAAESAAVWRAQAELILNAAGEGIYGLDLEGRCTFVNPAAARMTGHDVDELLGKPMHTIVHHSHHDGCPYVLEQCPIYAAFADGMVRNVCDEVFWRKDRTSFPVEYTSTPVYESSKLVGAVVVFRDISIRRATEERLRRALSEVQRLQAQLQRENHSLREQIASVRGLPGVVGSSAIMQQLCNAVAKVANTDSTVLILGETGTGKELVAQSIHQASPRRGQPLVQLDCASISPNLADSELFGHERGAFTGSAHRRAGRFEQANGGTLFLDEVGELPLETQAKLLRVLQEREFQRVGGNDTVKADVRVIAATNRDLRFMVKRGTFRSDLYFRLNVLPLRVPSLRERVSDIPMLVEHFLRQLEARLGRRVGRVNEASLKRLSKYHWPGNVRELQNVIEHAAIMGEGTVVDVLDTAFAFGADSETLPTEDVQLGQASERAESPSVPSAPSETVQAPLTSSAATLEEVERSHILAVLKSARWRISGPTGASTVLGIHPNTLRHRMKRLGISR
jgi:hydrogenase-4 transcriptional activator